jgi:hypothetical protein
MVSDVGAVPKEGEMPDEAVLVKPRCNRKVCAAVAVVAMIFATGCGSGSGAATAGSSSSPASSSGTAAYRAAVNEVFDQVVAARGGYEAAQGDADLRRAGLAIQRANEDGISTLHGLDVPASATALQAQLMTALAAQAAAVKAVLAASKLDTAKLGDAVRKSIDAERVVDQINALP